MKVLAVLCAALTVMTAVCGVLGYNLVKAYRMNRYSKNIWLGNNYFLTKYDDEGKDENVEYVYDGLSEVEGEVESFPSYLESIIYDFYASGELSHNDVLQIYAMLKSGNTEEAIAMINETAGMTIAGIDLLTKKLDMPYVSQAGILPNGCEAVSAVMLLKDKGYDVDPIDFVDNYLDCGEVYVKWGCRYGPDPSEQYAGDPKSEKGGWGCFAPVIVSSLNKYLKDENRYACSLTGKSISELAANYVANGTPVAIWCTQSMQEINEVYQWQSYDKKQTYLYPVKQHCMVLIGYDDEYYYFLDPNDSNEEVKYTREQTEYCYNSIGKQAVAILDKK